MIPNQKPREIESTGVTATSVFGISTEDAAHIMTILRDTLYTDKVMAVLREYSANAWDAHREAGKATLPIKVVIPTDMDPTLRIQDFGPGLSHQDVDEIFTKYGASTKRTSDKSVGMLGIGSKSGFAYSDTFTVISCHGGFRRTYVAVLDESEKGMMQLLDETECGEETGVTIEMAVRKEDILEFRGKAETLYRYFNPRPDINIDLPNVTGTQIDMKNGLIDEDDNGDGWVAVMGCVPYRINTDQLTESGQRMVGSYVDEIKGALYFNIGEVEINASREELKYSDTTKKVLAAKFAALMDEYVESTILKIEAGLFTPWEKRMRARKMQQLDLPLPEAFQDLAREWVELPPHNTFSVYRGSSSNPLKRIEYNQSTRLFIRDNPQSMGGYSFHSDDFVVKAADGVKLEDMQGELDLVLEQANLKGVPVLPLSTLHWSQPYAERKEEEKKRRAEEKKALRKAQKVNKKYQHKVFKLKMDATFKHPFSQMWEIATGVEENDKDIFVILENFRYVDPEPDSKKKITHTAFISKLERDITLSKQFGIPLPTIYAHKTTDKSPVTVEDVAGIHWSTWRKDYAKQVAELPDVVTALDFFGWNAAFADKYTWHGSADRALEHVKEALGPRHPITKWVRKAREAKSFFKKNSGVDFFMALQSLHGRVRPEKTFTTDADKIFKMLMKMYPMLDFHNANISELWSYGDSKRLAIEYVKAMDHYRRLQNRKRS